MIREELLAHWGSMTRRERDVLVAEKIFNFTIYSGCKILIENAYGSTAELEYMSVPNYSTDVASVWDVVLKMQNNSSSVRIIPQSHDFMIKVVDERGEELSSACSKSAPEAICQAALLAVLA